MRGVTVRWKQINVKELRKKEKMLEYREKIKSAWEKLEGRERWRIQEEWGYLKRRALEGGAEVCGYCKIGIGMRKGSELWNDSVKKVMEEKKNYL